MGAQLANQEGVSNKVRERIPQATDRVVQMKILKPLREVARDIPNWIKLYSEGKLRPGAVEDESFSIYLDPTTGTLEITDPWRIANHTAIIYVEENTCWALASRRETVYTAYQRGLPLRVEGQFKIRDMELIDEILELFYVTLRDKGKNITDLFVGVL